MRMDVGNSSTVTDELWENDSNFPHFSHTSGLRYAKFCQGLPDWAGKIKWLESP